MKRIIVIAGMGGGIGMGIAQRFGKENFTVVMLARSGDRLKHFKEQLEQEGTHSVFFQTDLSSPASIKEAFTNVRVSLGNPNVLVYNAAVFRNSSVLTSTDQELLNDFKVNVVGAKLCAEEVITAMESTGGGALLFTGGGLSLKPYKEFGSLSIGKAGVRSLAFLLAQELQPRGIRVGTVTVCGMVSAEDPKYNPMAIAEEFYKLYNQPPGKSDIEVVY